MKTRKKYDLTKLYSEIEEDIQYQKEDVRQKKDISQQIINDLIRANLKRKKSQND